MIRRAAALTVTVLLAACGPGDESAAPAGQGGAAPTGETLQLTPEQAARLVAFENRGIGSLERYDYTDAAEAFESAHAIAPTWRTGRLNLALAYLHKGSDSRPRARTMLEELLLETPDDVRALFAAGILAENAGEPEAALPRFRRAYELSRDPIIGSKLGTLLTSLDRDDEAYPVLTEVHAARPALVSPVNALMLLLRRRGDDAAADLLFRKLVALKGAVNDERDWIKSGEEIRDAYGNLGPYSLAATDFADPGTGAVRPAGAVTAGAPRPLLSGATCGDVPAGAPPYLGLAVFDADQDGDLDLVVCGGTQASALLRNDGALAFSDATASAPALARPGIYAVAAGELDVDPEAATKAAGSPVLPDLVVLASDGVRVLRNAGGLQFDDVTEAAGLADCPGGARGVVLFDADHDGDLDLFLAGGAGQRNRLYANRGAGTFVDVTESAGLAGDGGAYGPALTLDADDDYDTDLLVTRPDGPPVLFLNDRLLRFHAAEGWMPSTARAAHGALVADLDRDGREDLVLGGESAATWLRGTGSGFVAQALPGSPGGPVTSADPLLRGMRDLVFAQGVRLPAQERGGFGGAETLWKPRGLTNVIAADLDGDGVEELLLHVANEGSFVVPLTAEKRGAGLVLDFRGVVRNDVQAGWSNLEGRDAQVEVKAGVFWQSARVGAGGGFGVAAPTRTVFGIGHASQADFVRVLWPDAVQQGVLDVPVGAPYLVVEEQRRPDSCPLLFAWDGTHFAWVTDFLGAGGLGFLVEPGVYADPDPTESVKLPDGLVAPTADGDLAFKLVEAMEEIVYLDDVALDVVDLPPGVAVHPDERFTGAAPFADGALRYVRGELAPVAARDAHGRDVRDAIDRADRVYSEDPRLHPRLTGAIEESVLELDFGSRLDAVEPGAPLLLCLDGWIEYGYTRTAVAAAGEGFRYVVPTLETWHDDGAGGGAWRTLVENMGYPAGFPRVMTLDVTGLVSRETPRLRIRTNLEIYWDRVWLAPLAEDAGARVTTLAPRRAVLARVGYPREYSPDGRVPRIYDYDTLEPSLPWKTVEGDYTRFGDVLPLVTGADDAYVVYGKGEEIDVRFAAADLPALPAGWTRSYVLRFTGWCKGQELYIAHGFTVEPYPFLGMRHYPPGADERPRDADALRRSLAEWSTRRVRAPTRGE